MADEPLSFLDRLHHRFEGRYEIGEAFGELTLEVAAGDLTDVARVLRDDAEFRFEQLIPLMSARRVFRAVLRVSALADSVGKTAHRRMPVPSDLHRSFICSPCTTTSG